MESGEAIAEPKTGGMKPSDYSVKDYLYFAEANTSLKGLARHMGLSYSGMRHHITKIGVFDHVSNLLAEDPHRPGPKNRPPLPSIEGAGPEVEVDVEAIKAAAMQRYELKAKRGLQKEDQHVRFPYGPVALFIVSDQHLGNQGTDVARVFAEQDMILDTPGSYVWQAGDIVDSFIVGRLIAENLKPSLPIFEQWSLGKEYFERFGNKLIAHVAGNHDGWHRLLTGIDYARDITPRGMLYDADEIRATIHVGEQEFRIWSRHKVRGASMYNSSHGLERAARFDSSRFDIYAAAHVHRGAVAREFILDSERKLAVMSGTYKSQDDFSRQQGFERHDSSTAVAIVLEDDGSFWGTANIPSVVKYMRAVYTQAA